MILNELQYRITKAQTEKFKAALRASALKKRPINLLHALEIRALTSQLEELREQLRLFRFQDVSQIDKHPGRGASN